MKHVKEQIMVDEIVNPDIENAVKNVKSSEKAVEDINQMEKIRNN